MENTIDPKVRKAKSNLLYISLFSIVMLFAGLTSAYIVSQGDKFWISMAIPKAFVVSTIFIVLSSITYIIANKALKNNKVSFFRIMLLVTFLLGMGFCWSQYNGWKELYSKRNAFVGPILNLEGMYGDPYSIQYNGYELNYDGYQFYQIGVPLEKDEITNLKDFIQPFYSTSKTGNENYSTFANYSGNLVLLYEQDSVGINNGKLSTNKKTLTPTQVKSLSSFSKNIIEDIGDIYVAGIYGEDYTMHYKGEEVFYEDRMFFTSKGKLSPGQLTKLKEASNISSTYIYFISGLHMLHVIGALLYLLSIVIGAIKKRTDDWFKLNVKLTGIFWHFLGGMWLYLFLFLYFIH